MKEDGYDGTGSGYTALHASHRPHDRTSRPIRSALRTFLTRQAILVAAEGADEAQERPTSKTGIPLGRPFLFPAAAAQHGVSLVALVALVALVVLGVLG